MKKNFIWSLLFLSIISTTAISQNQNDSILILKSDSMNIIALEGKAAFIKDSINLFGQIDERFNQLIHNKDKPTQNIKIKEFTLSKDATFSDMFKFLDLNTCVLTQNQICQICIQYKKKLKSNSFNFFLFKEINSYYVAIVTTGSGDIFKIEPKSINDSGRYFARRELSLFIPVKE